jgi:hypothetical protein
MLGAARRDSGLLFFVLIVGGELQRRADKGRISAQLRETGG